MLRNSPDAGCDRLAGAARSKLIVALPLIVGSAIVALPGAAYATVAFNTNLARPEVWVSANEDGAEPAYVGYGLVTQVSPDGRWLAYASGSTFNGWELIICDVATRRRSARLTHMHTVGENILGERTAFAWSPDSKAVAVLQNERKTRKQTLYVIGVEAGGSKVRIATGHFRGVSFSPDGEEVVFGLAQGDGPLPRTDIARQDRHDGARGPRRPSVPGESASLVTAPPSSQIGICGRHRDRRLPVSGAGRRRGCR